MTIKLVLRKHPTYFNFCLFRVFWTRGTVGDGKGYSAKLSFGFRPRMFVFEREWDGWIAVALGVRIHYKRSYGGYFV